jgi:hypothetical protein
MRSMSCRGVLPVMAVLLNLVEVRESQIGAARCFIEF